MRAGACITYGANSFINVVPATADRVAANHDPSVCNAVKYAM